MPTYSNIHAHLDNSELHPPKDFVLAGNDTLLAKNPLGEIAWYDTYWQRPVLSMLDGAAFPPTNNHGDRYLLLDMGNSGISGTAWYEVLVSTSIDGSVVDSTVFQPYSVYLGVNMAWDGANLNEIVEYFALDKDGQPVNEWKSVTPKIGCTTYDISTGNHFHYTGTGWETSMASTVSSAPPYTPTINLVESVFYNYLQYYKAAGGLTPGQKYWVVDKLLMLEAMSGNSFSVDADHTREIRAYATIDITLASTGSIDTITVDSSALDLLSSSPVSYNGNIENTANDVANAINAGTGFHGFHASSSLSMVFVFAPVFNGSYGNSRVLSVTSTNITTSITNFNHGQDIYTNWFKVKYNFDDDVIIEMADTRGNHVINATSTSSAFAIPRSIDTFPWGHENVYNNLVVGGSLTGYGSTGQISDNKVYGMLAADGYTGGGCIGNDVTFYSALSCRKTNGFVVTNFLQLSEFILDETNGSFDFNYLTNAFVSAKGFNGIFGSNQVRHSNSYIAGASEMTDNTIVNSSITTVNTDAPFRSNQVLSNSQITLANIPYSSRVQNNTWFKSNTDLSNFSGAAFENNSVKNGDLSATYCTGIIAANNFEDTDSVKFDNYAGERVEHNQFLSSTNLDATAASGKITNNHIFTSSVDLRDFSGTMFHQNRLHNSSILAHNCSGTIEGNTLNTGTIEAEGCSGDIETNILDGYSELHLNSYSGSLFIGCQLSNASKILADNNSSNSGGITISQKSILDISSSSYNVDGCIIRLPTETFKLNTGIIDGYITRDYSTYLAQTDIDSSGILDLTLDGNSFAGEVAITNGGTLTKITGLPKAPKQFLLKNFSGSILTIDSSATNIVLPSNIFTLNLVGASNAVLTVDAPNNKVFVSKINLY